MVARMLKAEKEILDAVSEENYLDDSTSVEDQEFETPSTLKQFTTKSKNSHEKSSSNTSSNNNYSSFKNSFIKNGVHNNPNNLPSLVEMLDNSFQLPDAVIAKLKLVYSNEYESIFESYDFEDVKMKLALSLASKVFGVNLEKINRNQTEKLSFEAAFLHKFSCHTSSYHLDMSEDEFIKVYPDCSPSAVGQFEYQTLFKFRNLMKKAMHLIPPLHNKNHLLDLVTRVVEGKHVKHITGTGATKQTKARVAIILKEGNLSVPPRPPRIIPKSQTKKHNKARSSSKISRKRGRPRRDLEEDDEEENENIEEDNAEEDNNDYVMPPPKRRVLKSISEGNQGNNQDLFYYNTTQDSLFDIDHLLLPTLTSNKVSNNLPLSLDISDDMHSSDLGLFYSPTNHQIVTEAAMPLPFIRSESSDWIPNNDWEMFKPELLRQTSFFNDANITIKENE